MIFLGIFLFLGGVWVLGWGRCRGMLYKVHFFGIWGLVWIGMVGKVFAFSCVYIIKENKLGKLATYPMLSPSIPTARTQDWGDTIP